MIYSEAINYLKNISSRGSHPGLSRILELLDLLKNPQNKLNIIHVAGTNGKGSVSNMLASILTKSGIKTGIFNSPHIYEVTESICIDGAMISDHDFAKITEKVKGFAENMTEKPTEFEVLTAIAIQYFCDKNCDIVILEAGLGGRLDATNVTKKALLTIITDIGIDHTSFLGKTIKNIAQEKAGVIKQNSPVIFGGKSEIAIQVISNTCKNLNAPLTLVKDFLAENENSDINGSAFDFLLYKNLYIPLVGLHQIANAKIAIMAANILSEIGFHITATDIFDGLKSVAWRGRFEILKKDPLIIYDGAHNPEGMAQTVNTIKHCLGKKKVNVLMGVMGDKDYHEMVKLLIPIVDHAITITPRNIRALNSNKLSDIFISHNVPVNSFDNIDKAVIYAKVLSSKSDTPLIILGTLYMYKDIIDAL